MRKIVEPMTEERMSLSFLQVGGLRVGGMIKEVEVKIGSSVDEDRRGKKQDKRIWSTVAKYQRKILRCKQSNV